MANTDSMYIVFVKDLDEAYVSYSDARVSAYMMIPVWRLYFVQTLFT